MTTYLYHPELSRVLDQAWREAEQRRDRHLAELPIGATTDIETTMDATLQTLHRVAKLTGLDWQAK